MWKARSEILTGLVLAANVAAIVAVAGDRVLAANTGGDPAPTPLKPVSKPR